VRDKRITFQKLYDEGKYPHEMTWEDFKRFPIWVDCLEREGEVGEDFLAPIVPPVAIPYPPDFGMAVVRAELTLADGTILNGTIDIEALTKTLVGVDLIIEGKWEYFSVPSHLCKRLNKRPEEVFPIRFRCPVGFEGEEGVIEGEYPIDFRADRRIKLVRWRKHILYEQGKYLPQITWQDLDRFPFWTSDSPIRFKDAFFAPVELPFIPEDAGYVLVKAELTFADGTPLKGGVNIGVFPWERHLNGILLLVDDRLERVLESPQLCEVLGKGVREIFPVRFRCFIGFEGEEGVIEGEIPKTLHYDRPIKLGKGKKRR
jgi:hypothetical protein